VAAWIAARLRDMRRLTVVLLAVCGVVVLSLALSGAFRGGAPPSPPEPPALIVALDAGHGGVDPGAVVGEVMEKTIVADIVARIIERASELPRLEILATRQGDETVSNRERIERAEAAGAIAYVTVHVNASHHTTAHGIEVWVDKTRKLDGPSISLAKSILEKLVGATGARDRGVRSADLYLWRASMAAVSVEIGFLTNREERGRLLELDYQETIADSILDGITAFLAERDQAPVAEPEDAERS